MVRSVPPASNRKLNVIDLNSAAIIARARRPTRVTADPADPQSGLETERGGRVVILPMPLAEPRRAPQRDARMAVMIASPFAAGYVMSCLARSAEGSFGERMFDLIALGSHDPCLHAALYVFLFAVIQLPAGPLIDRHGLRPVQVGSLLVSAAGAGLLSVGDVWPTTLAGRALICLSSAGAFAAVARSVLLCVPPGRRAVADCGLVLCGGLGATLSTMPLGVIVTALDRRSLYVILAAATLAFAALVWTISPTRTTHR